MRRDGTPKFICTYICKINELLMKSEYVVSIPTFSLTIVYNVEDRWLRSAYSYNQKLHFVDTQLVFVDVIHTTNTSFLNGVK
jgi:hypothetical protein